MLYSDGNGFPLTVKPSHLFGSTERMDTAEILSAIVEQACLYTPEETPVGAPKMKRPKAFSEEEQVQKEAPRVEAVPKEAFSKVVQVPMVASNLVRFTSF